MFFWDDSAWFGDHFSMDLGWVLTIPEWVFVVLWWPFHSFGMTLHGFGMTFTCFPCFFRLCRDAFARFLHAACMVAGWTLHGFRGDISKVCGWFSDDVGLIALGHGEFALGHVRFGVALAWLWNDHLGSGAIISWCWHDFLMVWGWLPVMLGWLFIFPEGYFSCFGMTPHGLGITLQWIWSDFLEF